MDLLGVVDQLRQVPPAVAYGVLFVGAFAEYVVPPVPGDLVVLAGAALIGAFDWPVAPVFAAVTVGALLGGAVDYAVGRWLAKTGRIERLGPKKRKAVALVVEKFEKYGPIYIAVNRFVPGIRSFFFVAAGIAGLRFSAVMGWAFVGAAAWNAVLVGAGLLLGRNLEALDRFARTQSWIAAVLVAVVTLVVAWRLWVAVHRDEKAA